MADPNFPNTPQNPALKIEPLVTEGMKARRREVDRKKREAAAAKAVTDEENLEGWVRARRMAFWFVVALGAALLFAKVQNTYHDRWPLMAVWIMMAAAIVGGLGWLTWYMNRGD